MANLVWLNLNDLSSSSIPPFYLWIVLRVNFMYFYDFSNALFINDDDFGINFETLYNCRVHCGWYHCVSFHFNWILIELFEVSFLFCMKSLQFLTMLDYTVAFTRTWMRTSFLFNDASEISLFHWGAICTENAGREYVSPHILHNEKIHRCERKGRKDRTARDQMTVVETTRALITSNSLSIRYHW